MTTNTTYCDRTSVNEILEKRTELSRGINMDVLLGSLTYIVLILNKNRQIIFVNELLKRKLNLKSSHMLLGLRIGEAMHCKQASVGSGGCGTSDFCQYCGNNQIIMDTIGTTENEVRETRLTVVEGNKQVQMDLEVSVSPIKVGDEDLIVFSARDITDKKQKELLERTFYHDIINMAGTLDGFMEMMEDMSCDDAHLYLKKAQRLSTTLVDEIHSQRQLSSAEKNTLEVNPEAYEINDLVNFSSDSMSYHNVAKGRNINIHSLAGDYGIITDKTILNRVLINLLKNALEASPLGGTVNVSTQKEKTGFRISVQNNAYIPKDIQMQIFQRSFSTKGKGRGIGTYSIKLLTEDFLGGTVSFDSTEIGGTSFHLKLPQRI